MWVDITDVAMQIQEELLELQNNEYFKTLFNIKKYNGMALCRDRKKYRFKRCKCFFYWKNEIVLISQTVEI